MEKVNTPQELLKFMSGNIKYGYLGKDGTIHRYGDLDFDDKWYEEYVLESYDELKKNLYGNCWDQVEFERKWFQNNGYEIKTIYEMVLVDYKNPYPTHSYLIFKDKNNKWSWFENADFNNRGIHTFNSIKELIKYQRNKYIDYLKEFKIKDKEIEKIIITEFKKPKSGISAEEYLNHAIDSNRINIDN